MKNQLSCSVILFSSIILLSSFDCLNAKPQEESPYGQSKMLGSTHFMNNNKSVPQASTDANLRGHRLDSHRRHALEGNTKEANSIKNNENTTHEIEPRIVGGTEVEEGRFPYAAVLISATGNFICGGSLIEPGWVLTAAHCSNLARYVRFGVHHLWNDWKYEDFDIEMKITHTLYNEYTSEYDVALLKLSGTPQNVQPVPWNKNSGLPQDMSTLTVTGWGKSHSPKTYHPNEVNLQYMSNSECSKNYGSKIKSSMMCAGGWLNPGKDACQGDSGGPLVRKGATTAEDRLYGVVSWGYICGDPKYPGVYARVSSVADWIENEITPSPTPPPNPPKHGCGWFCRLSNIWNSWTWTF